MSKPHYTLPQVGEIWENDYLQRLNQETIRYPTVVMSRPYIYSEAETGEREYYFDGFCLTRQRFIMYLISHVNHVHWKRLA